MRVPRSKYRAVPTMIDGITFHSKAEAARYGELKLLALAGEICGLTLQPKYPIGDPVVAHYIADFQYYRKDGEFIVEDVKGVRTPVYRLKKKLVEAQHGIRILEV